VVSDVDVAELEAIVRAMPRSRLEGDLRAMLAARDQAATEPGPASLLPSPEFPGPRFSGAVRWSCRYRCGWSHTETPGLETPGPLVLPVGFGPEDVEAALTRRATESHQALQARVTSAFTEHYATAHPERQEAET
jgi:hypothetical protein